MYRTKGDDGNSSTENSSCSSDDDSCSVGSIGSQVVPPPSLADDTTSLTRARPSSRGPPLRRVVSAALLCILAVTAGVGWCRGCVGYWTEGGRSSDGHKSELKTDPDVASRQLLQQEENRNGWQGPIRRVLQRFRDVQDGRRRRRKLLLEQKNRGDEPVGAAGTERGGNGSRRKEKRRRKASGDGRGRRARDGSQVCGVLPEALVPRFQGKQMKEAGCESEEDGERERGSKKRGRRRKAAKNTNAGGDNSAKRKRRALQAVWRRVTGKLGGDGVGGVGFDWMKGGRKDGGDGEVELWKAAMLADLRERLEQQHGETLWARAKAVNHELNDGLLLRYLEMAYWTNETMGQPLPDAVLSSVLWREGAEPHLVTDQQVAEEATYGKMYVRGHDREGRPIIYYRPGLEKSFDTEKGLNLLFYTLERAKSMLPKGQTQFAVVADCSGFGPSKTPPLPMLKTAFVTMQRHYPMRLGYVMIANAGGPIVFVWKLISTVLEERTKEKISFLSKKEAEAKLTGLINPSNLPITLPGGLDDYVYSNEDYLSLR